MAQLPLVINFVPQMCGPKLVYRGIEFILTDIDVVEKVFEVLCRELLVIFINEIDSFLSGNFAVTHFLRSVIGASTDAKLDERSEVVEGIYFVIDTAVL